MPGRRRPSGKDRHGPVGGGEELRVVVESDVLRAAPDVRRVDLELEPDDELLPRRDVAVVECQLSVTARLAYGTGLDRVDLHLLGPAGIEDERGFGDVLLGLNRQELRRIGHPASFGGAARVPSDHNAIVRLELGSPVNCTDGPFGELADIVIDPTKRRVTHLVVAPDGDHGKAKLVPIELASAEDGEKT